MLEIQFLREPTRRELVDEDAVAMADKEKHFWEFKFTVTRLLRGYMLHGRPHARLEAKSGMSASE